MRQQYGRQTARASHREDVQALRAAGLTEQQLLQILPDVAEIPPFELWPENQQVFEVWCAMSTQWRIGHAGVVGLDYTALPAVLRLMAVPRKQQRLLFSALRDCEAAALQCLLS